MKVKEKNENKETARVLSMVSHDLKSPLNGIMGFTEILEDELRQNYPEIIALKAVEQIRSAGSSMKVLVENILSMAKIEAGRETPEFKWTQNLEKELKHTLEIFEFEARAKSIRLHLAFENQLPQVNWDVKKIRLHVLNNIISNALRFTPVGGHVFMKASYYNNLVSIQIQDTGPGIRTKDLDFIFEQFYSSDFTVHTRSSDGHGYGLYNARIFVESHNGRIFAENISSSIGEGAKFTVLLPVDPENI